MTPIDWVIVAVTTLLTFYGYMQGFLVGALSLAGFAAGAFVGTRLGPLVLSGGARSPYAPLFGLLGALMAGGVLASGLEGVGARARSMLRLPGLRAADGLLGGALTACLGLAIAWVVGAVALQSAGSQPLRTEIQRSAILGALDRLLPPSGPILDALARFDPLPSVHGPVAEVPAPSSGILAMRPVRAARRSVVRVFGTACGLGVEGSGWVAGPGLVVTNAHVVAGEVDTSVQAGGAGPGRPAEVVSFDSRNDLAVLRVAGLTAPSLPLAGSPRPGSAAALLGYPQDGPFDAQPARLGPTSLVNTQDAYGNGPVLRSLIPVRGLVRPGNSGGPLIDAHGRVVATVFAALTDSPRPGGFAVPSALVAARLARARRQDGAVGTGRCAG